MMKIKRFSITSRGSKWRNYKPYPTRIEKDQVTGELIDTGEELPRPGWDISTRFRKVIFNLLEGKYYSNDRKMFKGHTNDENRIEQLRASIRRGNIFDNDPYDPTEYTHFISKTKNTYIYSKDINPIDRMVYSVSKPMDYYNEDIGEVVTIVNITIINLREHKLYNKKYSSLQ